MLTFTIYLVPQTLTSLAQYCSASMYPFLPAPFFCGEKRTSPLWDGRKDAVFHFLLPKPNPWLFTAGRTNAASHLPSENTAWLILSVPAPYSSHSTFTSSLMKIPTTFPKKQTTSRFSPPSRSRKPYMFRK